MGEFSRAFELAVFSNYSLHFLDEGVFGVVARDGQRSVIRVLKFLSIGELHDPRRDADRAVRSRLIEANLQKIPILETSD